MPNTRPDTAFVEGVCDACRWAEAKRSLSWSSRDIAWASLVNWAKSEANARQTPYDCAIGVSGGKDSTFIVATCLRYGLHPVGINFDPSHMTILGQRNLDNLARHCDVIQVKKNAEVYRRMRQIGFREVGDSEWPNHLGLFSSVLRETMLRRIPLVLFGENPQAEYASGRDGTKDPKPLDLAWIEEFGGLLGLRLSDMIEGGFDPRRLAPYRCPSEEEMRAAGVRSAFLGDYFFWDTVKQAEIVQREYGFRWAETATPGSWWRFENLDDVAAIAFHDYLAYLKYGYTRAQAQLSIEIRHGYRTRNEAIEILRHGDYGSYPSLVETTFCESIGIDPDEVRDHCDRFVNPTLFKSAADGRGYVLLEPIR